MKNAFNYFYSNATCEELDDFFTVLNNFMYRVKEREEVKQWLTNNGELDLEELVKEKYVREWYDEIEQAEGLAIEELTVNKLLGY